MELTTKNETITTGTLTLSWQEIIDMLKEQGKIPKDLHLKHIKCPPDPNKEPMLSLIFEKRAYGEGESDLFLDSPISSDVFMTKNYNVLIGQGLDTYRKIYDRYKEDSGKIKGLGQKGSSVIEDHFAKNGIPGVQFKY